jgi:arylsulfatase A-like enzyme
MHLPASTRFSRTRGVLALVGVAFCLLLFSLRKESAVPKLNLVVIVLDTLRPDHLGAYGYQRPTSPNLDAWAAKSAVFLNAQSAAPWTAPSLISLMTSLYPSVHGIASYPEPGQMNERVLTLAEVLKSHGYWTGAFTEGGYAKSQFGLGQGFDFFPSNAGDTTELHHEVLSQSSRLRANLDRTLDWLDEFQDEPFFLFFHTYEVHGPSDPPDEYMKMFRPDWDKAAEHARLEVVRAQWRDGRKIDADGLRLLLAHVGHCDVGADLDLSGLAAKRRELGVSTTEPEHMQFWRDLYDAELRYTDTELQRLLDRLQSPELRANTVVIFVSDHGESFGEHGVAGHGQVLFEENLRVLLMISAPELAARRINDLVRSIDVMPTALELLGLSADSLHLQGRSLAPLLHGQALAEAPSFSHGLLRRGREGELWSVRDQRWRWLWDEKLGSGKLFDLAEDPAELHDVSALHPEQVARLHAQLRAQRELDAGFRERAGGEVSEFSHDGELAQDLRVLGYTGDDSEGLPSPLLGLSPPLLGDGK